MLEILTGVLIKIFDTEVIFIVPDLHYTPTNAITGYNYIIIGLPVMECNNRLYNVIVVTR